MKPRSGRDLCAPAVRCIAGLSYDWALAAGIVFLGLGLRLHGLLDKSLWFDEGWDVFLASQPIPVLLEMVVADAFHPPLHWLLLHGWIQLFGAGEFSVRLLQVIPGTIVLPLLFLVSKRLAGVRAALIAMALAATSPALVSSDQEVRSYALLTALCLGSSLALLSCLDAPGGVLSRGRIAYILLATLSLYTHNLALFVVAGQALSWVATAARRRAFGELRQLAATYLVVAVLCLPWAAFVANELTSLVLLGGYGTSAGATLDVRLTTAASSLVGTFVNLSWGRSLGLGSVIGSLPGGIIALGFLGAAARGILVALASRQFLAPVLLGAGLFGVIGIEALGVGHQPARYASFVAPWYYLLLALAIAALPRRTYQWFAAGAVLTVACAGLTAWYRDLPGEDWRAAAALLDRCAASSDVVLVNYAQAEPALDFYSTTPVSRVGYPRTVSSRDPGSMGLASEREARDIASHGAQDAWLRRSVSLNTLPGRLWLVESHERSGPELRAALERNLVLTDRSEFRGVRLSLFRRNDSRVATPMGACPEVTG